MRVKEHLVSPTYSSVNDSHLYSILQFTKYFFYIWLFSPCNNLLQPIEIEPLLWSTILMQILSSDCQVTSSRSVAGEEQNTGLLIHEKHPCFSTFGWGELYFSPLFLTLQRCGTKCNTVIFSIFVHLSPPFLMVSFIILFYPCFMFKLINFSSRWDIRC